jgi:hypothetical protein
VRLEVDAPRGDAREVQLLSDEPDKAEDQAVRGEEHLLQALRRQSFATSPREAIRRSAWTLSCNGVRGVLISCHATARN